MIHVELDYSCGGCFASEKRKTWIKREFQSFWGGGFGVRPLRFHDARHTFASWALASGQSIKWVQERLGHSSAELTLRTYAHLMPSEGDEMGWIEGRRDAGKDACFG